MSSKWGQQPWEICRFLSTPSGEVEVKPMSHSRQRVSLATCCSPFASGSAVNAYPAAEPFAIKNLRGANGSTEVKGPISSHFPGRDFHREGFSLERCRGPKLRPVHHAGDTWLEILASHFDRVPTYALPPVASGSRQEPLTKAVLRARARTPAEPLAPPSTSHWLC